MLGFVREGLGWHVGPWCMVRCAMTLLVNDVG